MNTRHSKLLITCSCLLVVLFLHSCDPCNKGEGGSGPLERRFTIWFNLYDSRTNENLLQIASRYRRDSVRVFDAAGNVFFPGPAQQGGSVVFKPILPGEEYEVGLEYLQTLFLTLYEPGRAMDIDTIRMEYSIHLDDCNDKIVTYLNFYYNEEFIVRRENLSGPATVSVKQRK